MLDLGYGETARRPQMNCGIPMDDEQVTNTIAELERCLRTDDPSLARRLRRIRRGDSARSAAVFAALVTAAILLAAGLAIASGVVWFAGVAALLAAFAVAPHREPTAADSPTLQGRRVDQWQRWPTRILLWRLRR